MASLSAGVVSLLLLSIWLPCCACMRLQLEKNLTIVRNSQYAINMTSTRQQNEDSHEQIFVSSTVSVFRRYPIDSSIFDAFLLDGAQEIECYAQAVRNYNQMQCPFLSNSQQSNMRVSNTTILFQPSTSLESMASSQKTLIIDNTQFPIQGAFYQSDLSLQLVYSIELTFDDYYYNLFTKGVITCSIITFYLIMWSAVLVCKVRRIKHNQINGDAAAYLINGHAQTFHGGASGAIQGGGIGGGTHAGGGGALGGGMHDGGEDKSEYRGDAAAGAGPSAYKTIQIPSIKSSNVPQSKLYGYNDSSIRAALSKNEF